MFVAEGEKVPDDRILLYMSLLVTLVLFAVSVLLSRLVTNGYRRTSFCTACEID